MPNGDSLEEKKKRLRELWRRAVDKYPKLADVEFPVDEQTGRLTPAAGVAYAAAKKGWVAPTPAPVPTTPAMPPTGPAGPTEPSMRAYVERRSRAGQIPAPGAPLPPLKRRQTAAITPPLYATAQPIPATEERLQQNITYMDDEGEVQVGGWDAGIYVDPEGQVRRRPDKPVLGPGRPSEAERWKQDQLLGKALTVQSWGGAAGEGVRTQRLAHAEPDWLKRKIVDPAAAVVSKAPAVTSVVQNFAKGALAAIAPGVLDRSTKEKLVRGIGEGVRGTYPGEIKIIPGLPALPLGGKHRFNPHTFYNQPFLESVATATAPMEGALNAYLGIGRVSSTIRQLGRITIANRPSNRLGTASQILRDLGETSDFANQAVANARRQHQEVSLLRLPAGTKVADEVRHMTGRGQRHLDEIVNLPNSPFKDRESVIRAVAEAEAETIAWINTSLSNPQSEVIAGLLRTAQQKINASKGPSTIYVKGRITRAYNLNPDGPTKEEIAWLFDTRLQGIIQAGEPVEIAVAGGGGIRISISSAGQVAAREVARGQGRPRIEIVGADVPGLEGPARSTGRIEPGVRAAPRAAEAVAPAARKRTVEELLEAGEYKAPRQVDDISLEIDRQVQRSHRLSDLEVEAQGSYLRHGEFVLEGTGNSEIIAVMGKSSREAAVADETISVWSRPPYTFDDVKFAIREEKARIEKTIQGLQKLGNEDLAAREAAMQRGFARIGLLEILAAREAAMQRGVARIGLEEAAPTAARAARLTPDEVTELARLKRQLATDEAALEDLLNDPEAIRSGLKSRPYTVRYPGRQPGTPGYRPPTKPGYTEAERLQNITDADDAVTAAKEEVANAKKAVDETTEHLKQNQARLSKQGKSGKEELESLKEDISEAKSNHTAAKDHLSDARDELKDAKQPTAYTAEEKAYIAAADKLDVEYPAGLRASIQRSQKDIAALEARQVAEAAPVTARVADVPVTPPITPAAETIARVADLPVTTAAPTSADFLRWSAREAARVAPGEQARRVTRGVTRGVAAAGDGPPGPPTAPGLEARWWEPGGWFGSPDRKKLVELALAHNVSTSPEALMQGVRPLGWVPIVGKRIKPIKISALQRFSGSQDLLRLGFEKAMGSGDLSKANKLQKVIGWVTRLGHPTADASKNPAAYESAVHALFTNDQDAWLTTLLGRFQGAGRFPVVEESRRSGLFTNPWLRGKTLRYGSLIDSKGSISLPVSKSHPLVVAKTLKLGDTHPVLFGDMMEAPSRYVLTADQRAWVDDAHTVVRELTDEFIEVLASSKSPVDKAKLAKFLRQIADAKKLRDKEGLEYYWPRFAEAPDGSVKIASRTGGQLDSIDHAGFMQERINATMQKGVEWGVNYQADPMAVLSLWTRAVLEQKRNALMIARLTDEGLLVRKKTEGFSRSRLFSDYDEFYLLDPKNAGKANLKSVLEGALSAPWQERTAAVAFGESPNQLAWAIAQVFRGAKSATSTTKTTMTGLADIGVSLLHTTTVVGIGRTRNALQVGFTPGDILTAGGMLGGPQAFVKGVGKGAIVFLGELGPSGTRGIYQRNLTFDDLMTQGQRIGGMNYDPMIEYFVGVSGLGRIGQGKWGRRLVLPRLTGAILGRFGRASSAAFHQGIGHGRAAMFDSYYQILRVKVRDLILQRNPALRDWTANPQSRAKLEKLLEAEMNTREVRGEALRLGRRSDGMLGVTNVRGLGISRTQQDIEGTAFLFSSVYTRSLLGQANVLAGSGAMPKETAYILARSLGAAAATIFTIRLELERRRGASFDQAWRKAAGSLNPRNGREFMAIPVGNGWYGLGGLYRSVAVFIGAASSAEEWDWGEGILEMIKGNPITRFWRGRQPPIAGLVTDVLEGEKFTGEPFDITDFFDVTDPEEALEAWFEQVGPFNIEAVIESSSSGATPWAIAAAVGLETMGGRYVPARGSDIKQQAIANYLIAEPDRAMNMEPPLTYLTKPEDLSKDESNKVLAHPDNAGLVALINELEEKQKGWYGEEGKFWTAVHTRRKQMMEDLKQLEKDAEAQAGAGIATLDRPGISGQPRNYHKVAERYYIANYQSILADYYSDIDNLMTAGREEGWLRGEGAPKAKRLGLKAQRDYFVLMDGDLDEENDLLSEAYERVVRPYLKKEYGVEGRYSPLEMGVQQQIDYNEYHLRLEALRAYYGSKLIDATRTAYRAELPKMEKARRDDADYIRENYYNIKISPPVLDRFFRSEETKRDFVRYIRASQSNKQAMLNAAPEDSPIQLFPQIEGSSVIRDFKLDARRKDSRLEELLIKWGEVQKPIWEYSVRQGAAWFQMPKW